jgi:hypothetical protein
MSTPEQDRPEVGHNNEQHEPEQRHGLESPHELLAVDDPSDRSGNSRRSPSRVPGGPGVTVQWLRPTELAMKLAGHGAAGVIHAHREAHLRLRDAITPQAVRERRAARLAPLSAFGSNTGNGRNGVERSVIGR